MREQHPHGFGCAPWPPVCTAGPWSEGKPDPDPFGGRPPRRWAGVESLCRRKQNKNCNCEPEEGGEGDQQGGAGTRVGGGRLVWQVDHGEPTTTPMARSPLQGGGGGRVLPQGWESGE